MKHRILYCSLLYDYAEKDRGYSYEYYNLEHGMKECAVDGMFDLEIFHIDDERIKLGQEQADIKLVSIINKFDPTIIFHTPFDDNWDINPNTLLWSKKRGIKNVLWNQDTSWRFQDFILPRKDRYTHFITTHHNTVRWFKDNNMKVIKSQWGGSSLYKNWDKNEYQYDVSFVGQRHGIRAQMVDLLNNAGIKVHLFGQYWQGHPDDHGFISFDEMIAVFNSSRININFSNPFTVGTMQQIKGRHFEIPQTGGFQLSTPADDLASYFIPNKEIVVVDNMLDMMSKIVYYLQHDEEREAIALAGYNKMLKEHTWKNRFINILKEIDNEEL